MARCDMYQSLVDLLGLLVTANYKDLPSLQELTKMDSVRYVYLKLPRNYIMVNFANSLDPDQACHNVGQISIQTVWHSDCIPERIFGKS